LARRVKILVTRLKKNLTDQDCDIDQKEEEISLFFFLIKGSKGIFCEGDERGA